MSYLPNVLDQAKVLITVKTYPLPSNKYQELVCTAGVMEDGRWIRIYPIPFRSLPPDKKFEKYEWIQADLIRNTKDFRPESYKPKSDASNIVILSKMGTENDWAERKQYVLKEVFTSFVDLIRLAKGEEKKSLATFRPREFVEFVVEKDSRHWKERWEASYDQYDMFDVGKAGHGDLRKIIDKVSYKFSYKFLCEGESNTRTLMIEDWEIGALYWNCLNQSEGDEGEAIKLVQRKYFDEFLMKKDIYLFVGTTQRYHNVGPNPFVIIGVFYPPTKKDTGQETLFP